jgi:hypothetical protein
MYRGDTAKFMGVVLNSEDTSDVRNITDDMLFFTAKTNIADVDGSAIIAIKTGTGITAPNPTTGVYYIEVPASATNAMTAVIDTVLQYDVQLVDPALRVYTLDRGTLTIKPDITRSTS